MRLICADNLMKRFRIVAQSGGPVVYHVSDICAAIEDEAAEESVDAAPVVRCKDCEKWHTPDCIMSDGLMEAEDNDFCSYGERRTRE